MTVDQTKIKSLSEEQIDVLLEEWMQIIQDTFSSPRKEKLLAMYQDETMRHYLRTAPASSKVFFHNAHEGGYLLHVLKVIRAAQLNARLFRHLGGVVDATDEEIVFAAMHHDLGKLGDEEGPYYVKETDPYWLKKGFLYKRSTGQVFSTRDRTFYLLNKFDISYSRKEMIGIQMADGMFEKGNETYFLAPGDFPHKTIIGYIIHWADWMSTMVEKTEQRILLEGK